MNHLRRGILVSSKMVPMVTVNFSAGAALGMNPVGELERYVVRAMRADGLAVPAHLLKILAA